MPRYFFNVRCNEFEETDMVGRVCANDVGALHTALSVAGTVIQRRIGADIPCLIGDVEVEDERHELILTLPLRAASY